MIEFDSQIPSGPLEDKWENHLEHVNLVGPRNRPTYDIIVVGTGLAGASAASSLAAQGYRVHVFIYHDTPRRAHSLLGASFAARVVLGRCGAAAWAACDSRRGDHTPQCA